MLENAWNRGREPLLIEAPPGAGKTTGVPPRLLSRIDGELWVVEPRRLAARLAAARVAQQIGERVGQTCGYQVRFDRAVGPGTRLHYVTPGILLRRLAGDPALAGIDGVVFDEFHERHLETDLGLALVAALRRGSRPALGIAVMSATLDAGAVAAFLGDPVPIRWGDRPHPVEIEYDDEHAERPLEVRVRAAVRRVVADAAAGHVLVFLPGAAEIRRATDALAELAGARGAVVLPLHGELPAAEQDRAVGPSDRIKIILSTNVAESSITIEGVSAVIDSGLARVASHSPWTGLPSLELAPISRASAEQRAGRAGRTGPGRCIRLYSQRDHDARPAHEVAEVRRADLAAAALLLASLGHDPRQFGWFEAPPPAALDAALELLRALDAIDPAGAITAGGAALAALPMHPRLARLVADGNARGVGRDAAAAAALLGERTVRRRHGDGRRDAEIAGDSDVADWVDRWRAKREIERGAARAADQLVGSLGRKLRQDGSLDDDEREQRLRRAVLAAFPDRVARRRLPGDDLILCGGDTARLDRASVVRHAELVVVVRAEIRRGVAFAEAVSAIEPEWLLEQFPDRLVDHSELRFAPDTGRVEQIARLSYGSVVIDETRRRPDLARQAQVEALLADAVWATSGLVARLCGERELAEWRARLELVRQVAPELGVASAGDAELRAAVAAACAGKTSLAEVRADDLLGHVRAITAGRHRGDMDRLAPARITLRSGRSVPVHYETDKPPWIESRMQDFFGMTSSPTIAGGRVALTLHLLAPNQRAVQVTSDLASFWRQHYPTLKKQLERRYPRHAWPDDPTRIQPGMRPRRD